MKKDRQRKVQEKLVGIIFILTLFLFLIINVIVPDREKSVQENRMLATKPKFRLSSLKAEIMMKNLKLIWMISLLEETCGES